MRRWLVGLLLLGGCGVEGAGVDAGLVGGTWRHEVPPLAIWQDLQFSPGRYALIDHTLAVPLPPPELGSWAVVDGKLQLTPDATPATPAMDFEVKGDALKIWWPAHLLREYDRR